MSDTMNIDDYLAQGGVLNADMLQTIEEADIRASRVFAQ